MLAVTRRAMTTSSLKQADFLIITALEKEAKAVVSRLEDHTTERFEDRNIRTYHCGAVRSGSTDRVYRVVVIVLPGMGELSAANAATDALSDWKPPHVLMVGIAGGIAQDDLDLGDVVVADQVVGYEYGKQTDGGLKPRDHVYPASALLLERVRNFWSEDWAQHVDVPRPTKASRAQSKRFVGPIASGNKVITSKKFQAPLLKRWPKLIAIETEAEGVFSAVFDRPEIKHALVIRGISDMADKDKDDAWQEYAANAAAAYAIDFLKSGPVEVTASADAKPASPTTTETHGSPVSNVSGGVNVDAQGVAVGQNLVGRDNITQTTINIEHATIIQSGSSIQQVKPVAPAAEVTPLEISTAKLPSTSSDLFGREQELAALDIAWADPHTNVLTLVAWGGVGKTALVNKWLSLMAADDYRGAERVFGWSFYSQGAAEGRQVSADQFIAAALKWFGAPDPTQGSPWDKGERLAELVRQSRTLLVLDGLEPLQNPPPVETGRLKDPALSTLLRELARHNPGLVVVTTRLMVDDLKDFLPPPQPVRQPTLVSPVVADRGGSTAVQIDLDTLSDEAGAAYLKHLGVKGTDEELKQAAHDFGGHALALTLLGTFLVRAYRGDIRKRDQIAHLTDERQQGAHAKRVLASYERWLSGKAELDILSLMGLFDRPVERGALDALRANPVIEGLTDKLQKLSGADWRYSVSNLRDLRLLAEADEGEPDTLDCHPLLREHFGEQLQASNPKAWREAHSRLYEYYKTYAKELPDTIEEMAPLFAAVAHGCLAGRHQEVLVEVYGRRVLRGDEHFSWQKLGTFGSDLVAMSNFFDSLWREPITALSEDGKAFVLAQAGLYLRALGRLAEAAQPMQTSLDAYIAQKSWAFAARPASNLSELYLTLGDLTQALNTAQQSIELADRSSNAFLRMVNRITLADALHQVGRLSEAEAAFREAEEMQKARQPEFPLLYSVQGFRYCDLLLGQGKYQEVHSRAGQTLEWAKQSGAGLLSIALEHLSLGRAYLQEVPLTPSPSLTGEGRGGGVTQAATHLQRAVDGLRQAGRQDYLPHSLLARAELHRFTGNFTRAQNDLDEAFTIATRGGMRLFEADCHLEYARLYFSIASLRGSAATEAIPGQHDEIASQTTLAISQGRYAVTPVELKTQAREHLAKAKVLIEQTGYHRRDGEVKELEAMINDQ
jgi:nucleoside phosphorylase/tetratricopeptide (TPR) repeat protein